MSAHGTAATGKITVRELVSLDKLECLTKSLEGSLVNLRGFPAVHSLTIMPAGEMIQNPSIPLAPSSLQHPLIRASTHHYSIPNIVGVAQIHPGRPAADDLLRHDPVNSPPKPQI